MRFPLRFFAFQDQPGCFLSNDARKKFIGIFESRMWQESRDGCTGQTLNFRWQIEKQSMLGDALYYLYFTRSNKQERSRKGKPEKTRQETRCREEHGWMRRERCTT